MSNVKQHLIPAILTALTTLMILVIAEPFGGLFDFLLKAIAPHVEILFILRIAVSLIIIILSLIAYIFYLHKQFNFKKKYKFGVYWKELTPFCPHCGGKLVKAGHSYIECKICKERLYLYAGGGILDIDKAIEEMKKDS